MLFRTCSQTLREDLLNHFAVIDFKPFAAGYLESPRIKPELMQDSGVNIGNVVAMFDGVKAQFIRGAVLHTGFNAAAG